VHTALQLAPVLAVKSKTPFYVAGGLLVAWALLISLGIGMRRPSFPSGLSQERLVIAISAVLVVLTVSMAVAVSGGEGKAETAAAATPQASGGGAETGAAAAAPSHTSSAPSTGTTPPPSTTATPTATTGTPTPSSSPAAGKASKVQLAADPSGQLAYDAKKLTAKAGAVSIVMANMSPVEHNVTIAQGSKVLGATPTFVQGSKTVTLNLKPGTYTFYCSVPGHRQAGMEGTLTVSP
jgi:plastocyanin